MSYPDSVTDRTVIVGGGVHGAIYAATYKTLTGAEPIVCEARKSFGGIFSAVVPFAMNSTHRASIDSVTGGPTRIVPGNPSDDLNYLPNSLLQVQSDAEYPSTVEMSRAVRHTIRAYAEAYTSARLEIATNGRDVYQADSAGEQGRYLGAAKRVIWATGLTMNGNAGEKRLESPAVVTAESFLGDVMKYSDRMSGRVCVIGGGDTACTVVEYLLGQGLTPISGNRPRDIDWFGGYDLPTTKGEWAINYHARYIGLARHMTQNSREGVLHPRAERAEINPMGKTASVRGRTYELVIDCRGFKPWTSPVATASIVYSEDGNENLARTNTAGTFCKVGPAAGFSQGNDYFPNRFPAANQAIYVTGPRTAQLAVRHAESDMSDGTLG